MMTEMDTRIHVNSRYLPISGVTIDVPGTISISSNWNRLHSTAMTILTTAAKPDRHVNYRLQFVTFISPRVTTVYDVQKRWKIDLTPWAHLQCVAKSDTLKIVQ